MHIPRLHPKAQSWHKNATDSETLQGSAAAREAVGKLPAHSELRWAPPATERVSSIPQTIETGSHPPRPQSLPARRALQ